MIAGYGRSCVVPRDVHDCPRFIHRPARLSTLAGTPTSRSAAAVIPLRFRPRGRFKVELGLNYLWETPDPGAARVDIDYRGRTATRQTPITWNTVPTTTSTIATTELIIPPDRGSRPGRGRTLWSASGTAPRRPPPGSVEPRRPGTGIHPEGRRFRGMHRISRCF